VYFGQARLAIQQPTVATTGSCVYCGMCLYGCPYGLIYSAQTTLERTLTGHASFTHRPGFVVTRLLEGHGAVTIEAVSRDSATTHRLEASRVYLAAGAIASTAILLNSLDAHGARVPLRQSDHFLLPLALDASAGRVASERLHTLSQMFIEILDRSISRHAVHLQLYTYNDLYLRMAKDRLGAASALVAPLVTRLIERIVMIKGYLHSDDSSGIAATLEPRAAYPTLRLEAARDARSRAAIRAVAKLLMRDRKRIGAFPVRVGLRTGLPGSGVHVGGSFPMRRQPGDFESDILGRPIGFTRIHVVDATVFPTIPAAPPTLTIMANAFRIASGVHAADEGSPCSP